MAHAANREIGVPGLQPVRLAQLIAMVDMHHPLRENNRISCKFGGICGHALSVYI
jgi:hypothetical protein